MRAKADVCFPHCCEGVSEGCEGALTLDRVLTVPSPWSAPPSGIRSGPNMLHHSFDFVQQVHYSHNPLQPGPMFVL